MCIRDRVKRHPHGLGLADQLFVGKKRKATVPARAADAGTPGFAADALVGQQRSQESGAHPRQYPQDMKVCGAEMQGLRVYGSRVLHDVPQERRLCDAAVINMAVIDLVFTGKQVGQGDTPPIS